jgi:hypothetical protein
MPSRRLTKSELEQLDLLIFHLSMLQYGMSLTFSRQLEELSNIGSVPRLYNTFALMHLITTIFLVDKRQLPMGGFAYRVLIRLRLAHLLEPIRKTMERKLGKTTLGDYLRRSRNKLAVHGDLDFASLSTDEQDVTFNEKALQTYERLMEQFERQVGRLKTKLERRYTSGEGVGEGVTP